jgi:hypothetical protein
MQTKKVSKSHYSRCGYCWIWGGGMILRLCIMYRHVLAMGGIVGCVHQNLHNPINFEMGRITKTVGDCSFYFFVLLFLILWYVALNKTEKGMYMYMYM